MKTHKLKTVQPYFERCWLNSKTFEVRKNDRDFQAGDQVILQEYDAEKDTYSGREITGKITYVLPNYHAIKDDYVVFSFYIDQYRNGNN